MKYLLRVLTTPSCWLQNNHYSEEWDKRLNELMENNDFICDGYSPTASIGGVDIWVSNHPYASFVLNQCRPSRRTIMKAHDKLVSDKAKFNKFLSSNTSTSTQCFSGVWVSPTYYPPRLETPANDIIEGEIIDAIVPILLGYNSSSNEEEAKEEEPLFIAGGGDTGGGGASCSWEEDNSSSDTSDSSSYSDSASSSDSGSSD